MEYFVARGLVNAIRNRNLTTIHNIKSVVYHEEVSRFARELLCEKDRKELLGLCKSQEPWMRFIGAHFLSRINAVDAKKEISIILQDESDFIVKRELYISLAFLGEVAEFHNYITLLDNLDMRQQNDRLIFDYFGSQSNTIKGCVERLSKDFAYPTREMIIDYLGRYGGREQIPVLRYYYSDLNCIRETTINAISQIKLRNPRPHLIKLIILDMDGVIIDSITQQISAWADAANRFEISFSGDDEQFIRFTEGKKSSDIASELLIKHGQNPALAEALVQMKNTMMETKMDIKPIGGIIELIQIAKRRNIKLAVVTSSNRLWAEYVLRTLQIKSEIDVIVTADDVENGKPSPEPYEQALRELSIQSSYAAAIENSPYGIDSAQAANIFCFGITSTLTADFLMAADETIVDYAALYPLL
jgi:beta-phosphoglucomutase